MSDLRAGVIGAGYMGRHHLRVLGELAGIVPAVVVDPRPPTELAVPIVTDLAAAAAEIDLAILAAPSKFHEQLGLRLAQLRVPTLIEKPVATTSAAAARLVRAFAEQGVAAAAGHIERFNPVIAAVRAALAEDLIGPLTHIGTTRAGPFPDRDMPVGVVADLLVHDIDLVCSLSEGDYAWVSAQAETARDRPCEDEVRLRGEVRLPDGRTLSVSQRADRVSPERVRLLQVIGERGGLRADLIEQRLIHWWENDSGHHSRELPVDTGQPLTAELAAWRDVVRTGTPDPVLATLADGTRAIRIAEAVLASAAQGATVPVAAA
ncbi:Gfo/Idh/MocA family protein [Granulicoccus sp. GXG6511]|uniref:Gfo/Idh/MocA family protein n=1 Tax=Granulicoccus sp. GXG6511 TaxID=3381351 RepID=UPI003D7E3E8D